MSKRNYVRASVRTPVANRGFLHGLREIGEYMGLSVSTVRRYVIEYRLPVTRRKDSRWMTTKTLLDQWVVVMAEQTYETEKANRDRKLASGKGK